MQVGHHGLVEFPSLGRTLLRSNEDSLVECHVIFLFMHVDPVSGFRDLVETCRFTAFILDPRKPYVNGTLGGIRTPDTLLRTEVFCPAELRGRVWLSNTTRQVQPCLD
jgi:hypothetical protein